MNAIAGPHLGRRALPSWGQSLSLATSDWLVAWTALFIILNGLAVCIGWWVHVPILVQLRANDAPTHFNTALCFIFLGMGELGLVLHRRHVVMAAAGAVILLATLECAQLVAGVNLGIDTLLAMPFIGSAALHPGRMSGNTMVCFLLVAMAQLLMSKKTGRVGAATTAAVILKSMAAGIAFVALLGYVVGEKGAYGWTESVGMGMRSWAGFLLIIVARISALWQRDIVDQPRLPTWFLPFLGTTAGSLIVGLIWVMASPEARPFMLDPVYAVSAERIALAVALTVGTLLVLGTISVMVARHKALRALEHAAELGVQVSKRIEVEVALRENNQSLARSNRDLADFAYVASHDLKAPLRGIDSAAKWLEEDLRETLPEESQKILGLMRSRINRMETLLNDLLTYSRAGRTDTAVRETDVRKMFDGIVEILSPPSHISVRVEGELPLMVTATAQLEQVLRNLINNAIKHHDKASGEVVVSGRREGAAVEFRVRDDGPGIAPQYHAKIFELFQTLKRRDEVEGSGMGLAVVKKLVEQQNGCITVHSMGDGTGSEFRFSWPTTPLTALTEDTAHA